MNRNHFATLLPHLACSSQRISRAAITCPFDAWSASADERPPSGGWTAGRIVDPQSLGERRAPKLVGSTGEIRYLPVVRQRVEPSDRKADRKLYCGFFFRYF